MDLGSAAVTSTAIVMAGIAAMTYFRKGNKSNGLNGDSSFKNIHKVISEKLKDVVFKDTCEARRDAFTKEVELLRADLKDGINDIAELIKEVSVNGKQ